MNFWNIFNRKNGAKKSQVIKKLREPICYEPPSYQCTQSVLLCGSAYGEISYKGAYLLDTQAALDWVKKHSVTVWSSKQEHQQAREYIPIWFANPVPGDGHVALLDPSMRDVLMPYLVDFYNNGWLSIYCPQCRKNYETLTRTQFDADRDGPYSTWTEEWQCQAGHIVHRRKNEIRYFKPRVGNGGDASWPLRQEIK
jgi:hypothetical protein